MIVQMMLLTAIWVDVDASSVLAGQGMCTLKIAGILYEDDLLFGIACIVRNSLKDTSIFGGHGH